MTLLRVLVDGLMAKAEALPRGAKAARHLREACAALLDADRALEREGQTLDREDPA